MPIQDALRSSPHVLVVEDEGLIRMMVVDMLEEAGFVVTEAPHADAAWAILERCQADIRVLFTDIDMPGSMDGFVLAERVADAWPHIRLVVTSGGRRLADREVPDSGHFLGKPYRPKDLLLAIREAV
ncbi:response regulator [Methylobacterium sp. CM6241]